MLTSGISIFSIILQMIAAVIALSLIPLTRHRIAWILISLAMLGMTLRRVLSLTNVNVATPSPGDIFDIVGLIVSALMLFGVAYTRHYITDMFAADRVLRESEQRYRTLAQNIPNSGVVLFDKNLRCTLVEGVLLSRQGYTKTIMEGKLLPEFLPKPWYENFLQNLENTLNGQEIDWQEVLNDRGYSIHIAPVRDATDEIIGGMALVIDVTQQMQAEKERLAAYNFLQDTIDGVAEPVMVIGLDYQIKLINRVLRENYLNQNTQTPMMCFSLSHKQDVPCNGPAHYCPLHEVKEKLMPVSVTHEHMNKSGETRIVEILASPLLDDQGRITGIIEATRDVTDRVHAETLLRESEQQYRRIIEAMGVAIHVIDENLHVVLINQQFIDWNRKLNLPTDVIGKDVFQVFPFLTPNVRDEYMQVFDQGDVLKTVERTQLLGQEIFTETRKIPIFREGKVSQVITVVNDITERKQADEENSRYIKELEALARVSSAMRIAQSRTEIYSVVLKQICGLLDAGGAALILSVNGKEDVFIGMGCGDWAGWTGRSVPTGVDINKQLKSYGQLSQNNDAQQNLYSIAPQMFGELTNVASVPLIANNQAFGALWIGRKIPLTSGDMRLLGAIGNMAANAINRQTLHENLEIQLEALRNAQARLVQSEKLAAIGELVAGVAHELNNPLTTILLSAELTQQHPDLTIDARKDLGKIITESRRATNIVRSLLDFARQRAPERKPVQVNEVVISSLNLLSYELVSHNIFYELQLAPKLPITLADSHQLQQVFVNLINNAQQAMFSSKGQGRIKITTETGLFRYFTNVSNTSPFIRIIFEDNGSGIPPEIMPRIFDPFFTTKPEGEGTGLGLSVCHGIISEHDGHIWAESKVGEGATFFIELPVVQFDKTNGIDQTPETISKQPDKTNHLLVIDDEINVLEVIGRFLTLKGYTVDTVANGSDGLNRLSNTNYDLILCDIRMPGLSGQGFYKQVYAIDPRLAKHILFITGDTISPANRQFMDEIGASVLPKPFEMNELLEKIGVMINNNAS